MWTYSVILFLAAVTDFVHCNDGPPDVPTEVSPAQDPRLVEGEKRLSDQLLLVLEHFKQPDPVGIPGTDIPDPYPVPDMKQPLNFATVYFKNTAVHGVSKFRISYITAEIGSLEVRAQIVMDQIQARGNYTMSTWLNRAQGPFTVDVTGLKVMARGTLGVERDGHVRVQNLHIDLGFSTINVNFQNLGFFGSMFQGVINSIGNFLFDSIKPYILKEFYTKARVLINEKLDDVAGDMQFPNSISPLDMVVTDLRKTVRAHKMDPYKIDDYNSTVSIFTITLTNTWLLGLSSFQREGNITLKMEDSNVVADFEIGTQKLEGMTQWDISAIGGLMSRAGTASFSVEYVKGRFVLAQPLDTREKPKIRDLIMEVGNIQVRCDGAGTIDYIVEFVVNILPNLLRYQIMEAFKNPAKEMIQQKLDEIDVEQIIHEQLLPKVDQMETTGFKLSKLEESFVDVLPEVDQGAASVDDETYDEDQFFNF